MKEKCIVSWSGGKDAAFSLFKIRQEKQYEAMALLTSINAPEQRITMHGVRTELLDAQANAIGLPLIKMLVPEMPSMEVYETIMTTTWTDCKKQGAVAAVFGDIFLEDLRKYRETRFAALGLKPIFPLWNMPTGKLIREFIDAGFKAIVTCVQEKALDKSFAGRIIDHDFIKDLPGNVDPCGENGEFHTFVFDGPVFKTPVLFEKGNMSYKKYHPVETNPSAAKPKDRSGNSANPFAHGFWYCDLIPTG